PAAFPARQLGRAGTHLRQAHLPLPERPAAPLLVSVHPAPGAARLAVHPPRPGRGRPSVVAQRPLPRPAAARPPPTPTRPAPAAQAAAVRTTRQAEGRSSGPFPMMTRFCRYIDKCFRFRELLPLFTDSRTKPQVPGA